MILNYGKFKIQGRKNPAHFTISRKWSSIDSFIIFAVSGSWSSRIIGLTLFNFYIIIGQSQRIRPAPLTKEEQEMFKDLMKDEE
jgi:hypothetical protein